MRFMLLALAALAAAACEPANGPDVDGTRSGLAVEGWPGAVELARLGPAPLAAPEVFIAAPWGQGDEAFSRETVGAQTGPMAIAAVRDGGLAVLDTVAGRVHRFGPRGERQGLWPVGLETGDDLVALTGGGYAVLAYVRLPEPHHVVLRFGQDGSPLGETVAPTAATLPTALVAVGDRLFVEQRHGWLHALDASPRVWGRPAAGLQLRADLTEDRALRLVARSDQGTVAFERLLVAPWPITELLALEASDRLLALVLRHIDDRGVGADDPAERETWLVLLDARGEPLGRAELVDSRVTDAGRPFALGPAGDLFELVTTEEGVTVLRHRFEGGRS